MTFTLPKDLIAQIIDIAIQAGSKIMEIYNTADFGVEIKSDNSPLTLADKASHEIIMSGLSKTEYPILSEEGAKIPYEERKNWNRFWLVDPLDGTKEFIKKNGEFTVNIALIEKGQPVFGVVYAPALNELFYGGKTIGVFKSTLSPLVNGVADEGSRGIDLNESISIKCSKPTNNLTIVASRSHLNDETLAYIEETKANFKETDFVSKGSSLKLVLVAEGKAHLYPRFAPTMEWDTAAGHAIVLAAGGSVIQPNGEPVVYNKENLLNPYFIVKS